MLIPNIKRWHKRPSGMVEYHLTQAPTGHGYFSGYLHRFGKLPSPESMFCGYHTDDAHHTLFECDAWCGRKRILNTLIGEDITVETMVGVMIESTERWNVVH